jgi:hypothetical protein
VIDVEAVVRVELEGLVPLPQEPRRDWTDVLARAGHRGRARRRRVAIVLLGIALAAFVLLVAAPAFGIRPVESVLGREPTPSWTWPEGVPGDQVQVPESIRAVSASARGRQADPVDPSTIRQVVSVGNGRAEDAYLAARGLNGDICLAQYGRYGFFLPFHCLHDALRPGAQSLDERAVLVGNTAGGSRGSVVDYSTLIGVARSDVGRVELGLVDGDTIDLPLNRWRGFGYYATQPGRFPMTLRAYRTWSSLFGHHEKLVGEVPLQEVKGLAPTPLCGGTYGPCPDGVKP